MVELSLSTIGIYLNVWLVDAWILIATIKITQLIVEKKGQDTTISFEKIHFLSFLSFSYKMLLAITWISFWKNILRWMSLDWTFETFLYLALIVGRTSSILLHWLSIFTVAIELWEGKIFWYACVSYYSQVGTFK